MFKKNFKPKLFISDYKGQIFSLDALLALVLITVILGMSANAVDMMSFKISDYSAGKPLDRISSDAAEILIDTPGTPNWEKSNSSSDVTPGLAEDNNGSRNNTKILSIKKISQLQSRYPILMSNIIPRAENHRLLFTLLILPLKQ